MVGQELSVFYQNLSMEKFNSFLRIQVSDQQSVPALLLNDISSINEQFLQFYQQESFSMWNKLSLPVSSIRSSSNFDQELVDRSATLLSR